MFNKTMQNFGYPDTLVKEYNHWCICLRPQQITLGSLVLICKDDANKFSNISNDAFQEYPKIIKSIENTLFDLFEYDKINYLMLMMIDPNVHFHVFPRYNGVKNVKGVKFHDAGWPGLPDFSKPNKIDKHIFNKIMEAIKEAIKL